MGSHEAALNYAQAHTTDVMPLLHTLERQAYLRTLSPNMVSGPYQGKLLEFISLMIRPKRVLEIGTFTGYSTICIAAGLPEGGLIHTIEVNDELAYIINQYVQAAGYQDKIRLHLGDAANIIPTLEDKFDLVFLDAGKLDYMQHYELALAKTNPGGFILADNVLWDNKVPNNAQDATSQSLRAFNKFVQDDPRVQNLLLTLRDGLLIIRKNEFVIL